MEKLAYVSPLEFVSSLPLYSNDKTLIVAGVLKVYGPLKLHPKILYQKEIHTGMLTSIRKIAI